MLNCQLHGYYEDNQRLYDALTGSGDSDEDRSRRRKMAIDILRTML